VANNHQIVFHGMEERLKKLAGQSKKKKRLFRKETAAYS
jgi:hypothetical protein